MTTVGLDSYLHSYLPSDGQPKVKAHFWDTSGQERFRSITQTFYKNAHGVMLLFDVSEPRSFKRIDNWLNSFAEHGRPDMVRILIGNKIDLHREVTF